MRSRSLALVIVFTLGASGAIAGGLEPTGPPGSTMKTLQEIEPRTPIHILGGSTTAMFVISQPGSYYLAKDVYGEASKHGIDVTTDNVTIDLGGFSLIGVPGSLDGISGGRENATAISGLTVRNGAIRDWGNDGVGLTISKHVLVENLVVSGCGSAGVRVQNGIIKDTQADENENGFFLGSGSIIRCRATSNTTGFRMILSNGSMRESVATFNVHGLAQEAGGNWIIEGNVFSRNENGVSVCFGNIIRDNVFSNNENALSDGKGVQLRCGQNLVKGNLIVNNDIGVEAFNNGDEVVVQNSFSGNTTHVIKGTGNDFAPLQLAATSTNPWANIFDGLDTGD